MRSRGSCGSAGRFESDGARWNFWQRYSCRGGSLGAENGRLDLPGLDFRLPLGNRWQTCERAATARSIDGGSRDKIGVAEFIRRIAGAKLLRRSASFLSPHILRVPTRRTIGLLR